MIVAKLAAHFCVDLQFAKIGRRLRPLHAPASGSDKVALMRTIPKMGAELDRDDPAERENKPESRNDESWIADCGAARPPLCPG